MTVKTNYSLRKRLVTVSSVVLLLFVNLTALVLDQAFKQSLDTELSDRLQTQIYLLLGAAESDSNQLSLPMHLNAPNFNQVDSGQFAFVTNQNDDEIWRSLSAQTYSNRLVPEDYMTLAPGQKQEGTLNLPDGQFFYLSFGIAWELENKNLQGYIFTVAESSNRFKNALSQYRMYLWTGLSVLAAFLLLVFSLILYWGLSPLGYLAIDLKSIENGSKNQLEGAYPKELQSLTLNLNMLLQHEKRQHSRYRNTLSNLAHSLKTPLAILRGMVDATNNVPKNTSNNNVDLHLLSQQVTRMNEIIEHQLQRAVHVGPQSIHKIVSVNATVERLSKVIQKVYTDSIQEIDISIAHDVLFRGDEGDLMEVVGNILDNSGKYGNGKIRIYAQNIEFAEETRCQMIFEDNGPGINLDQANDILKRGVRADQRHQGQGIGLAVVVDIVDQYEGRINLSSSALGGVKLDLII